MNEYAQFTANSLFRTEALKIAPADRPFWYTSGTLGPYYINTHYLFGGQEAADKLLAQIDDCLAGDRLELPARVGAACLKQYAEDTDYRTVIDGAASLIASGYDAISGGERRDYHFSYAIAEKLGLPHITLFKDGSGVWTDPGFRNPKRLESESLSGIRVLHVADLVTEASSYLRAWLPALRSRGAEITETLAIVDRHQGGRQVLEADGVRLTAAVTLDDRFFQEAVAGGWMTEKQRDGILSFQQDPQGYMRMFLEGHPNFLNDELAAGGQAAVRARRALEREQEDES